MTKPKKKGRPSLYKPEHESHPTKIVEAVEALVDDFTEGKLVTAGDGQCRKS